MARFTTTTKPAFLTNTTQGKKVSLKYDENATTQPWVLVTENGEEVFAAGTRALCDRHVSWKGYVLV